MKRFPTKDILKNHNFQGRKKDFNKTILHGTFFFNLMHICRLRSKRIGFVRKILIIKKMEKENFLSSNLFKNLKIIIRLRILEYSLAFNQNSKVFEQFFFFE